jgi:hypothetical protein
MATWPPLAVGSKRHLSQPQQTKEIKITVGKWLIRNMEKGILACHDLFPDQKKVSQELSC